MNFLDKTIGWFSPRAGLKRARARAIMDILSKHEQRAYEGAKAGRRTDGWVTSGSDANAEIGAAASRLRARARDLVRNNPYAAHGVDSIESNVIGTGIIPRADPRTDRVWARWAEEADAKGQSDFYGLQGQVIRTVVESGSALVRRRIRRVEDGLAVPFQLEVMEPDYLDTTKTGTRSGPNYVDQGIEFDAQGRRRGYWLYRSHPGSNTMISVSPFESEFVPASEILHVFRPLRAGQINGVTWFAPAIIKMRDLDDYDEAELLRKKIEACLAAFVTTDDTGDTLGSAETDEDTGERVESFEPGMIKYLQAGRDVKFNDPKFGGGYAEYMRVQLHAIAASLGLTYELLTGDLSQVTFVSGRLGLLEFRRFIKRIQTQMLVPQLCLPVWNWFTELGMAAGALDQRRGRIGVMWTYPRFEAVEPLKDAMADLTRIRTGTLTLPEAISAHGYDPEDTFAEIAATNKKLDDLGIVLDCDPRKVAKSGSLQKEDGGSEPNPDSERDVIEVMMSSEVEGEVFGKPNGSGL